MLDPNTGCGLLGALKLEAPTANYAGGLNSVGFGCWAGFVAAPKLNASGLASSVVGFDVLPKANYGAGLLLAP